MSAHRLEVATIAEAPPRVTPRDISRSVATARWKPTPRVRDGSTHCRYDAMRVTCMEVFGFMSLSGRERQDTNKEKNLKEGEWSWQFVNLPPSTQNAD